MAAPFSLRLLVASAVCARGSKNGGGGERARASHKKSKKKYDDDEIRTHAILEGFTPVAEKMDCYVSHFLTGIISREKLAAESGRQCPKNVKVRLTTRE